MALPKYKDIIELIKKGATVEAQEKIIELRESALELQEENIVLREKVRTLEDELRLKQQLEFDKAVYWQVVGQTKDGPFCQRCFDVDKKLVRLQDLKTHWYCKGCRQKYRKI